VAGKILSQRMQPPARYVHVLGAAC
jgi:hypothetical protein